MSGINLYETQEAASVDSYRFLFLSRGILNIVKIVEYQPVGDYSGVALYNLAFGDYDYQNDLVLDKINSNNNDMYKVLYTILSTIPKFFKHLPDATLLVQGSDSSTDFELNCRLECKRLCAQICKKLNQRIRTYQRYLDRNFEFIQTNLSFTEGQCLKVR